MPTLSLSRRVLLKGAGAFIVFAALPAFAQQSDPFTPFTFRATDEALADLKERLEAVRWPEAATEPGFAQGPPLDRLQSLIRHWHDRYDWRRTEARLNAWPQFKTEIDGLGIHFIHVRSKHENALPIILTHGWPSTILLFQEVIGS